MPAAVRRSAIPRRGCAPTLSGTRRRWRAAVYCVSRGAGAARHLERLVEIGEDVVDVLDAHAQANTAGCHPRGQLLLRRHLPMCRRCRVAGKRLRIAQIHQTLEELECIVEAHTGLEAAADLEGH